MCGIYGYVGDRNAVDVCLDGLKRLEYRGYDSAGIAGVRQNSLVSYKEIGKVAQLESAVEGEELQIAISHTRWATHGQPTKFNAHPHFDADEKIAVVHNGIIENYQGIRNKLQSLGGEFYSETDTEVIPKLIASFYDGDLVHAVIESIKLLEGAYALAILHENHPDSIIVAAKDSPLVIGICNDESYVASDVHSLPSHISEVIYLSHGEVGCLKKDSLAIYDLSMEPIDKERAPFEDLVEDTSKGRFEHYTLKEIFEQPQSLRNAMYSRFNEEFGVSNLEGLFCESAELRDIDRILIIGCGTSYHAGCVAAYMFEDLARLSVQVEIASELRYKNPVISPKTLVIAISQSGETADTLAAVKEVRAKGAKVLAICNVSRSRLTREADGTILLRAGPEIGVCSTKAFTSQLAVLQLLVLQLARVRHMSKEDGTSFIEDMLLLPTLVERVLSLSNVIEKLAQKYAGYEHFFYIGRSYMYPTALEAALKLKEIAYVNANGIPAGELKHGPIALISKQCPTLAFCCNKKTTEKMISSLTEIQSRSGPIIAFIEEGSDSFDGVVDDVIYLPKIRDSLAPVPAIVAAQLFAYYIAKFRHCEIDYPRNLAKSVTVE